MNGTKQYIYRRGYKNVLQYYYRSTKRH